MDTVPENSADLENNQNQDIGIDNNVSIPVPASTIFRGNYSLASGYPPMPHGIPEKTSISLVNSIEPLDVTVQPKNKESKKLNQPYDKYTHSCRICRSLRSDRQLIPCPCLCSGRLGYVHLECLKRRIKFKKDNHCNICYQEYKICNTDLTPKALLETEEQPKMSSNISNLSPAEFSEVLKTIISEGNSGLEDSIKTLTTTVNGFMEKAKLEETIKALTETNKKNEGIISSLEDRVRKLETQLKKESFKMESIPSTSNVKDYLEKAMLQNLKITTSLCNIYRLVSRPLSNSLNAIIQQAQKAFSFDVKTPPSQTQ